MNIPNALSPGDNTSLKGRTTIVTGASSGIGLATAKLFLDCGAQVHAVARRKQTIVDEMGEERVASGRLVPHLLDVTDTACVERLVEAIAEQDGLDILVLAAGMNVPDRQLDRLSPEAWNQQIAVNLNGIFYFVRAALPYLRSSHGDAVLISSVSGMWPDLSGAAYQASKMGVLGLARAAGYEEHQRGVRFSSILPGLVDTPILDDRPEPPVREVRNAILSPDDVASACLFLVTLPPRAHVPELTIVPTVPGTREN